MCADTFSFASTAHQGSRSSSASLQLREQRRHGWEFDIRTGQSWFAPTRGRVRRYEVTVTSAGIPADDRRLGQSQREHGPYVAETSVTAIDQSLVVVDMPEYGM